jgi:hypothetical protein
LRYTNTSDPANFKEAPGELSRSQMCSTYLNRCYTNGKASFTVVEEWSQGKDRIEVMKEFKNLQPTGMYVQIFRSELLEKIEIKKLKEI